MLPIRHGDQWRRGISGWIEDTKKKEMEISILFFNPSLINLSLISSDHPSFVSASQGSHIQRVESHDWWLNNLSPAVRKVLELNGQLWLKSVTVELLIVVDYELKALDTMSRSSCGFRVPSTRRSSLRCPFWKDTKQKKTNLLSNKV